MKEIYESFDTLLEDLAAEYGDKPAIAFHPNDEEEYITYAELKTAIFDKAEEYVKQYGNPHRVPKDENDKPPATILIHELLSKDWIIDAAGAIVAGFQTALVDVTVEDDDIPRVWENCIEYHPESFLFFTSGTTSKGRAVVLTQTALLRCAWNGQKMLPCSSKDRLLSVLPLTHVFGFVCGFLWPLTQGATIQLGTGVRGLATDPVNYKPTIMSLVPTMLKFLLQVDGLNPELGIILVGGGPCDKSLIDATRRKGVSLYFGYGLTETASGIAISSREGDPYAMRLCPDTLIEIGEKGELLVKTPCIMESYYNDPEATRRKLVDGWFHTGDLAFVDRGTLHVIGRMTDVMVLPGGEKMFCTELEAQLSSKLQRDVALCLRDNELTIIVVASEHSRREIEHQIDQWNDRTSDSRQIRRIEIRTAPLPRSGTGKLQRWKLYTSDSDSYRPG